MITPLTSSYTEILQTTRQCMIKQNWHGFLVMLNDPDHRSDLLKEREIVYYLTNIVLKRVDIYTQFLFCKQFFSSWSYQQEDHQFIKRILCAPDLYAPKEEKIAYAHFLIEMGLFDKGYEFLKSHFMTENKPEDVVMLFGEKILNPLDLLTLLSWYPACPSIYQKIILSGDSFAIQEARQIFNAF